MYDFPLTNKSLSFLTFVIFPILAACPHDSTHQPSSPSPSPSLKLNARSASSVTSLSLSARRHLRQWLWADYLLYDHFTARLEARVLEAGRARVREGVQELARLNMEVREDCLLEEVADRRGLPEHSRPWSRDVIGYRVREERGQCRYLAMAEVHFVDRVREEQQDRLDKWRRRQEVEARRTDRARRRRSRHLGIWGADTDTGRGT